MTEEIQAAAGTGTGKTYTLADLARLIGFNNAIVTYAARTIKILPAPGTKKHAIAVAMAEKGITWDQVTNGRGSVRKPVASPVLAAKIAAHVRETAAATPPPDADPDARKALPCESAAVGCEAGAGEDVKETPPYEPGAVDWTAEPGEPAVMDTQTGVATAKQVREVGAEIDAASLAAKWLDMVRSPGSKSDRAFLDDVRYVVDQALGSGRRLCDYPLEDLVDEVHRRLPGVELGQLGDSPLEELLGEVRRRLPGFDLVLRG